MKNPFNGAGTLQSLSSKELLAALLYHASTSGRLDPTVSQIEAAHGRCSLAADHRGERANAIAEQFFERAQGEPRDFITSAKDMISSIQRVHQKALTLVEVGKKLGR